MITEFLDTYGGKCIRIRERPDSSSWRDEMRKMADDYARDRGIKVAGSRLTGSILRSENPRGLCGAVYWFRKGERVKGL